MGRACPNSHPEIVTAGPGSSSSSCCPAAALGPGSHGGSSWAQVTEAIKSGWKAGSWVSLADLLCGRGTVSEGLCIH